MSLGSGRLDREYRTMHCMVQIYCADHHATAGGALCGECGEFLGLRAAPAREVPVRRRKAGLRQVPDPLLQAAQREQARSIMRYAGPRMVLRHPWLSLTHMLDKLRRVEHPMDARRRERP